MDPIPYCRVCLLLVEMAATPEDRKRLDALLDAWSPDGELREKQAQCARCGRHGRVLYLDSSPRE